MDWKYGSSPQTIATERPRCWGKSFDETSRECKGCGFQNSCKEEIIRLNVNRQPAPAYPSHQPLYPPAAMPLYQQPYPPYQPEPMRMPRSVQVPVHPQPVPIQMARPSLSMQPVQFGFGWIQDPLYYQLHAAPPPVRPQMAGEGFFERAAKNAFLALLESFFGSCFLTVRQMILPPEKPATGQVIEVMQGHQQR